MSLFYMNDFYICINRNSYKFYFNFFIIVDSKTNYLFEVIKVNNIYLYHLLVRLSFVRFKTNIITTGTTRMDSHMLRGWFEVTRGLHRQMLFVSEEKLQGRRSHYINWSFYGHLLWMGTHRNPSKWEVRGGGWNGWTYISCWLSSLTPSMVVVRRISWER